MRASRNLLALLALLFVLAPAMLAVYAAPQDLGRAHAWAPGRPSTPPGLAAENACVHPWPCADGSEWPAGLAGPFAIGEAEAMRIPVADGVELEAYVWRPILPAGVRAPVVMHAQPYAGQCYNGVECIPRGDDPMWLDDFALRPIIEAGFALVNVNVRGTGTSGGCFDLNGPREAQDLALAVEWLAALPWTNGRVGMTGISYMGTTPFLAANLNPPSLKTIVPGAIVSSEYTFEFTPQGAAYLPSAALDVAYAVGLGGYPTLGAPQNLAAWADVAHERACPGFTGMLSGATTNRVEDERNATFFGERDHILGFPDIKAAVFVYHGLQDAGGHRFAEDAVWSTLAQAPRRMMLGDWGHAVPADLLEGHPETEDWGEMITGWLDFWLKGVGAPARLGLVDYEDRTGVWRTSAAWPPAERADEVHYLAGTSLAAQPAAGLPSGFLSVLAGGDVTTPLCGASGTIAVFEGPVLEERVVLAGNPHAYLLVESDGPAGLLAVDLYAVGPDALCAGGQLLGGEWLSGGTADLRYHAGNLAAIPFPVSEPTNVRIDMANFAAAVEPGHRLVVVASGYGHVGKIAAPAYPTLALHAGAAAGASHVVLPVVEGALGGAAPTLAYPERPFVP